MATQKENASAQIIFGSAAGRLYLSKPPPVRDGVPTLGRKADALFFPIFAPASPANSASDAVTPLPRDVSAKVSVDRAAVEQELRNHSLSKSAPWQPVQKLWRRSMSADDTAHSGPISAVTDRHYNSLWSF